MAWVRGNRFSVFVNVFHVLKRLYHKRRRACLEYRDYNSPNLYSTTQMDLKAEMEVAMKLLEKDIHEKQDTIISLRRQLDDIKLINLEMYKKLQECEMELTQKGEMVSRLQAKAGQIGKILNNLEKYNHLLRDEKKNERKLKRSESKESAIVKSDSVAAGMGERTPFGGGECKKSPAAPRPVEDQRRDGNDTASGENKAGD